ncbi:MAG: hypothetical protein WCY19_07320 [Candidatus Gastranaerophilaceae bacterium]
MFYKLGKKLFLFFVNFLKFIQVLLVFLSFFIILYWLFQLGEATFIKPFAPFFEGIKNIVHIFYFRTVKVDEIAIDFSFLIATFVLLFIVWGLRFVIEDVDLIEKKYDSIYNFLKKKVESIFNLTLEQQYLISEHKNNNFLILVKFTALNLSKDSFFNKDAAVGIEEKQREILADFSKIIAEKLQPQRRTLEDGLLLYFENFQKVDGVILDIEKVILNLKNRYYDKKFRVNFLISIETYSKNNEITEKLKTLLMLNKLGLKDKIICLSTFKQRYSLVKNPRYFVESLGIYEIKKDEEVFCIKSLN